MNRRFPHNVMARGRTRRTPGTMNKTEAAYAATLELRKAAGELLGYWYEAVTFKLAKDTRYTPDFLVQLADGTLEAHEVKGFWEDDARVKIKVAASMFPVLFRAMKPKPKKHGGGWEEEVIGE
jgi:hypothetical protein